MRFQMEALQQILEDTQSFHFGNDLWHIQLPHMIDLSHKPLPQNQIKVYCHILSRKLRLIQFFR